MASSIRFDLTTPVIDDRPVFITGNFYDWNASADALQMEPVGPGQYVYEFPADASLPDVLDYKYTKGGWEHVELDASAEGVPNRSLNRHEETYRQDYVPHWSWHGQPYNPEQLPKQVGDEFHLPQLDTTRRINVLLPYDYDADPEPGAEPKRYPVLYLHDGQNLIGDGAGYGSWHVDQKMAVLAARRQHEVILVTIDHGEEERIREYTVERTREGRGKGRQYIKFIKETLKPFIDANLRTLPDPGHTGVGGSSLGGLISIYAGLMYPDVFGRLMVFSPSLWISPKIYFDAIRFQAPVPMKVYIYGGEAESAYMVPNMQRFNESLLRQNYGGNPIELTMSVRPEGTHEEAHWSREFPKAVEWLFY